MSFNAWVAALCAIGVALIGLGLWSLARVWRGLRDRDFPVAIFYAVLAVVAFALMSVVALALLLSFAAERP